MWGLLRSVLGRLRDGVLGAFLGRLRGILGRLKRQKTVLEPFWSCPGSVLEASWDVLGRLGSVFGASCGTLRGFLGRLVWLLEPPGASWRHLVRDFQTKKWLHVSLAFELPVFNGFLFNCSSNFDLQNYVKYDSRLGKTYTSNKIDFRS